MDEDGAPESVADRQMIHGGNGRDYDVLTSEQGEEGMQGAGQLSLWSSTFNLTSTIVGGGVLSLPFSIQLLGVFGGGICLIFSGAASEYSVYLLMACSSKSGLSSYADIAHGAFGLPGAIVCSFLLFVLTFLCCIAYLVLTSDLISPLLLTYIDADWEAINSRFLVQSIFIVLVSPLCFLKTMSALRFTSFLSIITVFCLAAVICARSIGYNTSIAPEPAPHHNASQVPTVPIKFFADSFEDALYGIPIFSVAFLCHFNVLPLKGELRRPTRSRLQRVIRTTILTCASLYIIVAYSGYLEFRSRTCGNILLNFPADDFAVTCGRIGLACTLIFSFPLLVQPSRNALHSLMGFLSLAVCPLVAKDPEGAPLLEKGTAAESYKSVHAGGLGVRRVARGGYHPRGQGPRSPLGEFVIDSPRIASNSGGSTSSPLVADDVIEEGAQEVASLTDDQGAEVVLQDALALQGWYEVFARFLSTAIILGLALRIALSVAGIMQVWSLAGSFVGTIIAYIIPSASYLRLRRARPWKGEKLGAAALLIGSIILCTLCTWQAVAQLATRQQCLSAPVRPR